jgi:glycosyltransferase involved in cell wall biosynthesis
MLKSFAFPGGDSAKLTKAIEAADAARDARNWLSALELYRAALDIDGSLAPIWVQYGHALKEMKRLKEAETAYLQSVSLDDQLADTYLQLGHLHKIMGRVREAERDYARALERDPGLRNARAELSRLGWSASRLRSLVGKTAFATTADEIYFDLSDLVQYYEANRAPTGIQRVQIEIVNALVDDSRMQIVAMRPGTSFWKPVPTSIFKSLVELSMKGTKIDDPEWRALIKDVVATLSSEDDVHFSVGACLVNLGTSWWIENYFAAISEAKKQFSIRYVPFIHDIIPIKVPEHCSQELVCEFAAWIYSVLAYADLILVNSEHTARDVRELSQRLHGRSIDPIISQLDAAPAFAVAAFETLPDNTGPLTSRPFVLFVGTLESRKNHLFVFDAWLELVREVGVSAAPNLICVGKRGWLNEAALGRYENSSILKRKVILLSNISDIELATLYRECLFTIYNSHYEGWGLPVTESLAFGKVPLVAQNTSLVEPGGGFAEYFAPGNREQFLEKLNRLLFDEDYRKHREAKIADSFRPRTWPDIAQKIVAELTARKETATSDLKYKLIKFSTIYSFERNHLAGFDERYLKSALLRTGLGWSHAEDWGVWSKNLMSEVKLIVPDASEDLLLYIELVAPHNSRQVSLLVNGIQVPSLSFQISPRFVITLPSRDIINGALQIALINDELTDLTEISNGADRRCVGAGLKSLFVCKESDFQSRLRYIEWFGRVTVVELEERQYEL